MSGQLLCYRYVTKRHRYLQKVYTVFKTIVFFQIKSHNLVSVTLRPETSNTYTTNYCFSKFFTNT